MATLERIFLEPLSTLTHLAAGLLALPALALLLLLTRDEPAKMISLLFTTAAWSLCLRRAHFSTD